MDNLEEKIIKEDVIPKLRESYGWYIYSNISNETKIIDLNHISDKLHLNLTIEECKLQ